MTTPPPKFQHRLEREYFSKNLNIHNTNIGFNIYELYQFRI